MGGRASRPRMATPRVPRGLRYDVARGRRRRHRLGGARTGPGGPPLGGPAPPPAGGGAGGARDAALHGWPGCEVVVLAAPATPETTGMVDETFLAAMAPGSVLVNVARGALVDEPALLAALDRGRPEAAILDVFATEPLPADSPFWGHPKIVLTPHSSAGGLARHGRVVDLFLQNLARYREGRQLVHEVPPARGVATRTWLDEAPAPDHRVSR